jgi:uncharacterized protein YndB with AHSA1/START domain
VQRTEKFIEVNAPVEVVFDLYSDFESFPRWMKNVREVRRTGRRYTHWVADAPFGMDVEWEAETTRFEPNRRIAWRSVRGDVEMEGEVAFQETRRGTTLMRVRVGYEPPAGRLGSLFARLFGSNPDEQMEEELRNFARMAESLAERRRVARHADRAADTGREPARAIQGRERSRRREEIIRMDERAFRDEMRRDSRWREDCEQYDYSEEQPHWERMARQSFEEALRHARRSQIEGMRQYNEGRGGLEQQRRRRDHNYSERGRDGRAPEEYGRRRDFRYERDEREAADREQRRRISAPRRTGGMRTSGD